jgi:integrase
MASFRFVIQPYQKGDKTRNVFIRIIHNRKKRDIATQIYLAPDDLTKSGKIKNQVYIDLLNGIIKKCRQKINEQAERLGDMHVIQVSEMIRHIIEGKQEKYSDKFNLDFIRYGREYVEHLKNEGKTGTASTYNVAINNLVKFTGRENISIHEINAKFIISWIEWIRKSPPEPGRKKGDRAESLYYAGIRALHNRAKAEYNDEEIGFIRIPLSPFLKVKQPPMPEVKSRALPSDTIRKIFALQNREINWHIEENQNNRQDFARDMFMLSFMLVGMNEADLFNCTDYTDGRITYQRTKVMNRRRDRGKISIRIEPEAIPLMEKYRDRTGKRVFCFYQMYSSTFSFTCAINGNNRTNSGLKRIGKEIGIENLTFYAARHSWASIALNDVGIDKYTVHTALNHVIDEMKITDIYIKKDWKIVDNANRKVLDYIFQK